MDSAALPRRQPRLLAVAAVTVVVGALYLAREFLIPLALAALFSFLLTPLVTRVQRFGLGRVIAVLIVVGATVLLVLGVAGLVAGQIADLAANLPSYKQNLARRMASLESSMDALFGRAARDVAAIAEAPTTQSAAGEPQPVPVEMVERRSSRLWVLQSWLGPVLAPVGTAGIVFVIVVFMLVHREDLRDRFIRLVGGDGQIQLTTQALDEAAARVSRYLLMMTIINACTGLAVGVGLFALGVPNALLWGLLSALLRFLPYIGPWIAALLPIALSLATFDDWTHPLLVVALFLVIELVSNNVLEPWLYGAGTGVSPVAVIVSALFWTWLWGAVGLFLATPLTACLVVLGKYVPQLSFLNVLLGDEPVLSPGVRFYQRLLALDAEEATEVFEEQQRLASWPAVCETLLLPTLLQANVDAQRGFIDARQLGCVRETIRNLLSERGADSARGSRPAIPGGPEVCALCVPVRDETDELAAAVLRLSAESANVCLREFGAGQLAAEVADLVVDEGAPLVVLSAVPPGALVRVRYLCKRLLARRPDVRILACFWDAALDPRRLHARLGSLEQVTVVTTLRDARDALQQTLTGALLRKSMAAEHSAAGAGRTE